MDEVGELHCVLDEENGDVVADDICMENVRKCLDGGSNENIVKNG